MAIIHLGGPFWGAAVVVGPWGRHSAEGTGRTGRGRREGVEKRWREAGERLETKDPSARNSPEKPKQSTEDGDRVSLLLRSRSKNHLSRNEAIFGGKISFLTARSRL